MLREALGDWGSRCRIIPGNHDDPASLREVFPEAWPLGEGPLAFSFQAGGWRIIGLDSHLPGEVHGRVSSDQVAWLEAELASDPTLPALVFVHHPPIPIDVAWIDELWPYGLPRARVPRRVLAPGQGGVRRARAPRVCRQHRAGRRFTRRLRPACSSALEPRRLSTPEWRVIARSHWSLRAIVPKSFVFLGAIVRYRCPASTPLAHCTTSSRRHSRAGGNPGVDCFMRVVPYWIPAAAGMTES